MAGNFFDGPDDAAAPAPEQAAPQQEQAAPQQDYAPPGAAQGASDQDIVDNENAARRKINEKNQPKNFFGDEDDTAKPVAAPAAPKEPRGDVGYWQGLEGEVGNFLTFLHKTAGQSGIGMAAAEDPANTDIPALQSEWHTRMVEPIAQEALKHALPEDASVSEKLRYGVGSLSAMVAEAYLTGGASLSESVTGRVAEKLGAGTMLRRWAAKAAGGSAFMLPAAIEHATTVGDQVYQSTGDARASAIAASTAFGSTLAMGAIPFGARGSLTGWKGLAAGAASAFVAGAGSEEAQRVAENASKPDALQENFSVENMLVAGAVATPLGLLPHATPHVEAAENVNEMAQRHAAEIVREGGGDNLDAVGAATQVAAEVGGVHDAAAVHAAREAEAQHQQGAMEMRRAQAQAAAEADQADIDRGQQEQAAAEQKKAEEDAAYAEKAHQDQAAKDEDFQAAKNQTADEEVASSEAAETGTEKGGGNEPKPTLADALPPEQRAVLERIKAQRAKGAAEPSVTERMQAQDKGTEADFKPLAEEAPKAPEKAPEPTEAEEPETPKPPAPTPETLAERRQQALDEARAAAEGGARPPFPGEEEPPVRTNAVQEEPNNLETVQPNTRETPAASEEAPPAAPASEEAPEGLKEQVAAPKEPVKAEEAPPNRLAAIRKAFEAAKKDSGAAKATPAEGATAPEKGAKPTGFTPSTDEQLAKYAERAAAKKKGEPPMKAESGVLDNLKQRAANLKKWFGKSVVKNEDGTPKPLYHGTPMHEDGLGNLTSFDRNAAGKARGRSPGMDAIGSWFTDNPKGAGDFSGGKGAIYPVNAKIENPWRPKSFDEFLDRMNKAAGRTPGPGEARGRVDPEPLRKELQAAGHDGIIFPKGQIDGHEQQYHVVFDPEQVKSSVGNSGEYDPKNPDIAASAAENDWFNESQRHVAEDMDRALKPRMSHDEAREHLAPVLDHFGPRQFRVDPSAAKNTVGSPLLRQQISDWLADHPNGKLYGVYDPETGIAHVFADAHDAGDRQSLLETAVHELTHKGLPALLKEKYGPVMDQIYASVKDTKWAKDLVARRQMDLRSIDNQRLVADEYAAHMSENILTGREVHEGLPVLDRNPTIKQRFLDAVRSVLRALGITRHWNDHDIARLVQQAHMGLGDPTNKVAREGAAYKGPRFSADENDARIDDLYAPDHPLAIGQKIGRTAEEQGKYNPGFVKDTERLLKDVAHGKPDVLLGAIGLRNIPDFIRQESMPNAHAFIDDHDAMEGRRRMILKPTIERAQDWSKFQASQPDRGEALTDLMHAFTLNGLSADKPYEERHTAAERAADPAKMTEEKTRREVNKFLQQKFNEQPPEARAIYKQVRDDYTDMRIKTLKGLEDRINATGADEQTKKNAMAELRKSFESGQVKGDYFPLQRFGDLWASASDKEGNHVAFSRHESQTMRKEWLKAMRDQGFNVDQGERMDDKSEMERISPDFVKNVMAHIEAADPTGSLAKDVWQEYLKAMPEMSMRKHMITRVGRLGYSRDALRAYAFNMFHGAHQLARLEYGHKLDARLAGIQNEATSLQSRAAMFPDDKLAQIEGKWAPAIAREMSQRYDWLRNPRASKLASNITKFGFSWYLGAAPATAFRIFSQNPMLAAPQLAKHFGWIGASKELTGQSFKWAKSLGMRGYGDQFRGDERRAYDEADQRGVFSDTNTQMMASGGDGSPMFQGGWYQFQKYAGYMFNAMEHHNRATTLMAGYRLGRTQGMDHDSASRLARQITWDSHFDYTNANRPRYLQGDIPKVIGLFKQYSLGVTYRLAREGADMINRTEKTPQQRLMAAGALASLIGRMALFAGATGIPGYWAAEKLVNWWMGDDDKPYDMTAALHKHLSDTMGTTAADSIMTGPVGAISGASLSTGASYNDLWYKPNLRTEEPQQQVYDAMGQLLGPIGALPLNAALGGQQMAQGNIERGLEHFLPPEASALAKAVRYFNEGAKNTKGQNILPADQSIDNRDVFLQSLGFTPQKVADAQRRNTVVRNLEKAITDRRELLSGRYESAILVGDQKTAAETWTKIQAFNKANPEAAIGPGLASGTIGLARRNANSVQGIPQTPTTRKLEEKY